VYRCAGVDSWVAIAVTTDQQWKALRATLEDPEWARDPRLTSADGRRANQDRIDDELSGWSSQRRSEEIAEMLTAAGVPAAVVTPGPEVPNNPQLRHRRLYEVEDHPVTGHHHIPTMPFKFSRVVGWTTRPSPTLGQHNDEVLSEVATADELAQLRLKGVIGDRVAGE
jgi:crotonobetainyl-CoA:carnitine CoA-transferase CaiB-like acyl-CoA transferase